MNYRKPRGQPESKGASRLIALLVSKGWGCWKIGGGPLTVGWPDWYCFHRRHGHRWIETKAPGKKLRKSQVNRFQKMANAGDKIYVVHDETEYDVLFRDKDNWMMYLP